MAEAYATQPFDTYYTLRMESVYMVIGQAAGLAARLTIEDRVRVPDVQGQALTGRLRAVSASAPKA